MKTVLMLSTYEPQERMHGGQIRVDELCKHYKNIGFQVIVSGVLTYEAPSTPTRFVKCPPRHALESACANSFLMEDASVALLSSKDVKYIDAIYDKVNCIPALIHVEQPWLFRLAQSFRDKYCPSAPIIYGSQNVESTLKHSILSSYGDEAHANACKNLVEKIEIDAIKNSDACLAVTEADLDYIRSVSPGKLSIVVPNAATLPIPSKEGITTAKSLIHGKKFALFIASAHPPNVHGFFHFLGGYSAALSGDVRLVIAGSAGEAIANDARYESLMLFKHKIRFAGKVSQELLDSLILLSHQILLPILQGGGSNLKTAEALLSCRRVVTSSMALRGFDEHKECTRVKVCDSPMEFKHHTTRNFMLPAYPSLSVLEQSRLACLGWDYALSPIDDLLQRVLRK